MSIQKATLIIFFVVAFAQSECCQLNVDSIAPDNLNTTIGFDDTDSFPPSQIPSSTPILGGKSTPSSPPTSMPTTKNEFCVNTPGWFFGSSVKYTCDDDFVWCSDPGASQNCCKCKPTCCGYCTTRNRPQDLYQPCPYKPTLWPTTVHKPSLNLQQNSHLPKNKNGQHHDRSLIVGLSIFAAFLVVVTILVRINFRLRQEILKLRTTMEERRRDAPTHNVVEVSTSTRENRMRTGFFFDTVLPEMTNANADSLSVRLRCDKMEASENDDLTTKVNTSCSESNKFHRNELQPSSLMRGSTGPPPNSFLTSCRDQVTAECSICLECYNSGETICLAKADTCDHVFHEDCLMEWLKKMDRCPLCRMNLLDVLT